MSESRYPHAPAGQDESGAIQYKGWLPFNRKERFYTATVLPMLVASDNFAHLNRLLDLCGLKDVDVDPQKTTDIQFFTEYGFAESVFSEDDKKAWKEFPAAAMRDTPDIVIAGSDWLLAIEAKMFLNPTLGELVEQMRRQSRLVDLWSKYKNLGGGRVKHVLLVPEQLKTDLGKHDLKVVTWQEILELYAKVGPAYWVGVLRAAIGEAFQELQSLPISFGKNALYRMKGYEIVEAFESGKAPFDHVGRDGGLHGRKFQDEIAGGDWRKFSYEVCKVDCPPNRNWFCLEDFISATRPRKLP